MNTTKWDWKSLTEHKRAIKTEMENDIQKLEKAIQLISEVNETYIEAFKQKLENTDPHGQLKSLEVSSASAAQKLSRCVNEITLVKEVIETIKNRGGF